MARADDGEHVEQQRRFVAPRPWVRLDLAFLDQDTVRELGDTHGPAGPLTLLALIVQANSAALAGLPPERQGTLSIRYRALARSAFLDGPDSARRIVDHLIELGLVERTADDDQQCALRMTRWTKWEPKDIRAASRQRRIRERKANTDSDAAADGKNGSAEDDPPF
jgi:hypothetical protein